MQYVACFETLIMNMVFESSRNLTNRTWVFNDTLLININLIYHGFCNGVEESICAALAVGLAFFNVTFFWKKSNVDNLIKWIDGKTTKSEVTN